MTVSDFLWLEDIAEKIEWKHNVVKEEVVEVFRNDPHFRFVEKGSHKGEDVYAALGQTEAGRYITVFFIHKADKRALVLSARDMTNVERRRYEQR